MATKEKDFNNQYAPRNALDIKEFNKELEVNIIELTTPVRYASIIRFVQAKTCQLSLNMKQHEIIDLQLGQLKNLLIWFVIDEKTEERNRNLIAFEEKVKLFDDAVQDIWNTINGAKN